MTADVCAVGLNVIDGKLDGAGGSGLAGFGRTPGTLNRSNRFSDEPSCAVADTANIVMVAIEDTIGINFDPNRENTSDISHSLRTTAIDATKRDKPVRFRVAKTISEQTPKFRCLETDVGSAFLLRESTIGSRSSGGASALM
jgi:hypothetical protein